MDDVTWVKQTKNENVFKSHGYYLQHSKETCIIGYKGDNEQAFRAKFKSDHPKVENDLIIQKINSQS